MADLNGSYINPQYATPEQLKQLREYSQALMTGSGQQTVQRPLQGVSNIVNALVGGMLGHQADTIQQQALGRAAGRDTDLAKQLIGGQVDPNTVGTTLNDPMVSSEQKAMVRGLVNPQGVQDVYNRPAFMSPAAGIRPVQQPPGYQAGYRGEVAVSPEGVKGPAAYPAPQGNGQAQPTMPFSGGNLSGALGTMNTLAQNKSMTEGVGNIVKQDIQLNNDAQNVKKFVGTIVDTINANKGKITWGPTAEMSQEVKKGIVNYFPGMEGVLGKPVAAADAIQKMTSSLASVLSRQIGGGGGTDAQLINNLQSVPSLHNSEEGALALADMIQQTADHQQEALRAAMSATTPQEYLQKKTEYLASHPIINKLTGNPIQVDIAHEQMKKKATDTNGPGFKILGVR